MNEESYLSVYEQAGAFLSGHFVLSSGRHSGHYLQSALVLQEPEHATFLSEKLAALVDANDVDVVVAPALGGLIVGYEVARCLNRPFVFTERKEGLMCLRRGFSFQAGARVLVVEDVITTGGSVCECIEVVRQHGGLPFSILALVDRAPAMEDRFDLPHQTLIHLDVASYEAADCPLCAEGKSPAIKPGSRGTA